MSATGELISALVAGGMDAAEAAGLVARAAVEMTGSITRKSTAANRQQRYRERNKASRSVTRDEDGERNETSQTVTPLRLVETSQTVTNRNESVTRDAPSLSKEEKKEEDKKEKRESRACQLADDWQPNERTWAAVIEILGSDDRSRHELRKFRLHALDKGRLAKNWNAAFQKWAIQAVEYEGKRNGTAISSYRADQPSGRATAREANTVAAVGSAAMRYLRQGNATGAVGEAPGDAGSAGQPDPLWVRENHH